MSYNSAMKKIAVAPGDGIGPEIMESVLQIFNAAKVPLDWEPVEMGKSVFQSGESSGITDQARQIIENTGILFKGPMETPKGKGVKSINVTARKLWNTYANIRKFRTLNGVDTIFSRAGIPINMTVLRENIEDTYGGIEYMQSWDVAIAYRLISRPGTRQFMEFAFEYARKNGIKEIVCGHKSNIMKLSDGLFMNTFYDVAKNFPDIEATDLIVDDLAMKLVRFPERFKLIVLSNLQGDILSDLCAGLVGGLGFAPSANVGDNISIFEAVHGTAPDIAGKGIANPCSLLLSGLMMLRHLGLVSYADRIENALLYTLEQGVHTGDFGAKGSTSVSTQAFADAIIANFDKKPSDTNIVHTGVEDFEIKEKAKPEHIKMMFTKQYTESVLAGADVFIESTKFPNEVAEIITNELPEGIKLFAIANRGTQVWPDHSIFTECIAQYQIRLVPTDSGKNLKVSDYLHVCLKLSEKFDISDIELLHDFEDQHGYSLMQGQ